MANELRMVCLDFDGTILAYDHPDGVFHPAAIDVLNRLRERSIAWCVNSGRDLASQQAVLERSLALGLRHRPAALLCSETMIFVAREGRYAPLDPWNRRATRRLLNFHRRAQNLLGPSMEDWQRRYQPRLLIGEKVTALCVDNGAGQAGRLLEEVRAALRDLPDGLATQNGGWVAVLPADLGKGNVLRAYLEHAGLSPDATLAVGDHLNDLSMLDGSAARWTGCPADSAPEVIETVRRAGGHVAFAPGPEGTAEIIGRLLSGGPA